MITPVEQLIRFLCTIDSKFKNIPKADFLSAIIDMAADEAVMLQLCFDKVEDCEDNERRLLSDLESARKPKEPADKKELERNPIDGVYYDVRIRTHFFGGEKQVVFAFTNISAEKELQREIAMRDLTKIMFTSINHELRTPCNAISNGLELILPHLPRICMQYYLICQSSLSFLLSLIGDTLDYA
jgi:signal transduction histidine kinase